MLRSLGVELCWSNRQRPEMVLGFSRDRDHRTHFLDPEKVDNVSDILWHSSRTRFCLCLIGETTKMKI